MATCKNCGRSRWFLALDMNGLCAQCHAEVLPEILSHCRIVQESGKIIQNSRNPKTRLSRIEVASRSCDILAIYDAKGIPTLSESPQLILAELGKERTAIIEQAARDQISVARQRAEDAATFAGKLGGYAKAIEALMKLMNDTSDVAPIEETMGLA